jgi:hypothetical protein
VSAIHDANWLVANAIEQLERGEEPVCEMSHIKPLRFTGADLLTLLDSLPKPDRAFWDAVEDATRQTQAVPDSPWER